MPPVTPLVGIIMGSTSDWETLKHAAEMLERLGVCARGACRLGAPHAGPAVRIRRHGARARPPSDHRRGRRRGAPAGHVRAKTSLPVLGVPVQSKALNGLDSLLSIVQMPAGIPVGTLAIGVAGATNAALLAACDPREHADPRFAPRSTHFAPRRPTRCSRSPTRAASRHLDMKIGVIGAGQLGRMLALAGYPLALQFRFLDPSADSPGGQVAPDRHRRVRRPDSLERLAADVDLVTYEFENVPVAALQKISQTRAVHPPVDALRVSQDRLLEKQLFEQLRIPTPPFRRSTHSTTCARPSRELGLPCVLKTRRLGYDGKGQRCLRKPADVELAWAALGDAPLILEGFVDFEREVSIVGVRSTTGEVRAYPIVANTHRDGILRVTLAPHRHPSAAEAPPRRT